LLNDPGRAANLAQQAAIDSTERFHPITNALRTVELYRSAQARSDRRSRRRLVHA
jgi:hypothetical protein